MRRSGIASHLLVRSSKRVALAHAIGAFDWGEDRTPQTPGPRPCWFPSLPDDRRRDDRCARHALRSGACALARPACARCCCRWAQVLQQHTSACGPISAFWRRPSLHGSRSARNSIRTSFADAAEPGLRGRFEIAGEHPPCPTPDEVDDDLIGLDPQHLTTAEARVMNPLSEREVRRCSCRGGGAAQ